MKTLTVEGTTKAIRRSARKRLTKKIEAALPNLKKGESLEIKAYEYKGNALFSTTFHNMFRSRGGYKDKFATRAIEGGYLVIKK
jgi:hypothetical protein